MTTIRRWALDAFLVALAVAVAVALVLQHEPAAAVAAALCPLAFLGRRRWPFLCSVVAFAAVGTALVLSPRTPNAEFFALLASFAIAAAVNRTRPAIAAWLVG